MESNYLVHHGVKGMKWGVRKEPDRVASERRFRTDKELSDKTKKALKVGAIVVGSGLAIYGGYKLSGKIKDKSAAIKRGKTYLDSWKTDNRFSSDLSNVIRDRKETRLVNRANKRIIKSEAAKELNRRQNAYIKNNINRYYPDQYAFDRYNFDAFEPKLFRR